VTRFINYTSRDRLLSGRWLATRLRHKSDDIGDHHVVKVPRIFCLLDIS